MEEIDEEKMKEQLEEEMARYEEDGYFKRLFKMFSGLGKPRNSGEYKEAVTELQRQIAPLAAILLPLIAIVAALLWWSNKDAKSFGHVWNYFAWMNQILSATRLMTTTVWLLRLGRGTKSVVALVPGVFMCMVITTFIFWAWPSKGQVWGVIPGGLPLGFAACAGAIVTAAVVAAVVRSGLRGRRSDGDSACA
jgi:carbon starvation protein CstA